MLKTYFRFGNAEVVNNTRVKKYVENGLKPVGGIVPKCDDCPDIWEALGHDEYDTPILDDAPWYNPVDPDIDDFAGVMATAVTGLGGSTIQTEVVERVGDGGMVGSRRAASRVMQVSADLVGRTPAATAAGLEWLTAALHPPCSSSGGCGGETLHLFSACPETCDGQTDPDQPFFTTEVPVATLSVERGTTSTISTSPRTNVVVGPSFELDSNADGIADGWNPENAGTNGGITREVRSDIHGGITSGSKAQRIVSSAQDNATGSYAGVVAGPMALAPGAAYARVDVAALILPAGHEATMIVQCRNSSNTVVQTFTASRTSTGTVELTFTAPAGTTNAMMYLRQKGTGTGSATATRVETVWDSAMLVQGAPMDYFDGSKTDSPAFTYDWTGTPNLSPSTATGTGNWLSFDHTGSGSDGRIITPLLPGVCDEVTVSWAVQANGTTVTMQMLDSTGRVVQATAPTVVTGTRTLSLTVNPTPEFPGDWRTALVVNGDVIVKVAVTQRPLLTIDQCIEPYLRTFHNVVTIDGPKVVEEKTMGDTTDGSSIWSVEWTWMALEPHVWHETTEFLTAVPGKTNAAPSFAAPGIQITNASTVAASGTSCPRPAASFTSDADHANLPALVMPPQAPILADPAVMAITQYTRRRIEIPADLMPSGLGALSWVFDNDGAAKLGVRVRIWEKGDDPAFVPEPECEFVQEFYIDYLKANHTLFIDGPSGEIFVQTGVELDGSPIFANADRNVRGTYGGPFQPGPLGCGRGLVVSVDVPNTYTATGGSEYVSGGSQGDLTWSLDLTRRG
jgi:hypothetical protein